MSSGGGRDGGGSGEGSSGGSGNRGGGERGGGKPPRPELLEDPLLHPASDAGWDDEPPPSKRTTNAPPPTDAAAPTVSVPADTASSTVSPPTDAASSTASPPTDAATSTVSPPTDAASSTVSPPTDAASSTVSPADAATSTASPPTDTASTAVPPPGDAATTVSPPTDTATTSVSLPTDAVAGTLERVARDDATQSAARPWRSPSFPAYAPPAGLPSSASARPAEATPPRPAEPTPPRPAEPTPPRPAEPTPTRPAEPTPPRTAEPTPPRPAEATPTRPAVPVRSAVATPASPASATQTPAGDEPLLPASYHENDLRSAVGASPLSEPTTTAKPHKRQAPAADPRRADDDDDLPGRPRNRKTIVVAAFSIATGLAIAGLVFLGRANSDRYLLACEAERAVPQGGRAFPPWGTHSLEGEQWRPLKIAPETRCQPHETDDPQVLERLYLAMILDQATALLTAREVTKLDEAEALLKQALLLTRPAESEPAKLATERTEHHQDIERLLGDVTYWRASAKLHDAAAALADAAKQFDSAAAQHPRHVSDASAWADYSRKLADELHVGPAGATQAPAPPIPAAPATAPPTAARPEAPPGIALPVEPDKGGSAGEPPVTAPPPPDAGVPTGGVLL